VLARLPAWRNTVRWSRAVAVEIFKIALQPEQGEKYQNNTYVLPHGHVLPGALGRCYVIF
jgi:hypothetical protein